MALSKAVAVHTTVIVIMIAFFTIFIFFLLYEFAKSGVTQASQTACIAKKSDFCIEWSGNGYGNKPWNWQDKDPKTGCEDYNVVEPSADECRTFLHG